MYFQILEVVSDSNKYYVMRSEDGVSPADSQLEVVLTDVESFECQNSTWYLNGTGPLYNATVDFQMATDDLHLGPYFGFCVFIVVIFTLSRLFSGRYNQLLLLMKFKKNNSGDIEPVKFSVAFTIICNMSKFVSVQYVDLCGMRAMATERTTDGYTLHYLGVLVYCLCWGTILTWLLVWGLTCGLCCMGRKAFMLFRRCVLISTVILSILWFANFDPSFDFDVSHLDWFSLNVVSLVDLVLSLTFDIYLGVYSAGCCSCQSASGQT